MNQGLIYPPSPNVVLAPDKSGAATAAANTASIQAALNAGGKVSLVGSGVAFINATLVIGSNTELEIRRGLTLKLANNTNTNALVNKAYTTAWTTLYDSGGSITTGPLSLIWAGNVLTWTQNTGFSLGNYVAANGNIYWCATTGTSLNSGTGPSGTGTGISDGTCTWNYVTVQTTPMTVASKLDMAVHWPAHGMSVGQSLWLTPQPDTGANNLWTGTLAAGTRGGPADSAYFGVFYVSAVNDANYLTVTLRRLPAAAFTGIPMNVKAADQNIKIAGGGTIDYNSANQASPTSLGNHAVIMAGVQKLVIDDLSGINVAKFVLCLGGVSDYDIARVQGGFAGTGSDQIKVYGPAFNGCIRDMECGTGGDDALSIQTQETSTFATYIIACGDILGLDIERISLVGGVGIIFYPLHSLLLMDSIKIDHVWVAESTGAASSPIRLSNTGVSGTAAPIGTIIISNVEVRDGAVALFQGLGTGLSTIDQLIFEKCRTSRNSSGNLVRLVPSGGTFTVKHLLVKDCQVITISTDVVINLSQSGAGTLVVNRITVDKCLARGSSGSLGIFFQATATNVTLGTADISDCELESLAQVCVASAPGVYNLTRNRVTATAFGLNITAAITARLAGNYFSGMSSGVVRYNTTAAQTVYSDGANILVSGSVWFNFTQAATPIVFGWDINIDVTKATRNSGSYCFNTNAAAGTLGAAGLVSCQGTAAGSWTLLGNPTLNF